YEFGDTTLTQMRPNGLEFGSVRQGLAHLHGWGKSHPAARRSPSRVERWRGGLGAAYPFAGPFVPRCLTSRTMPRFHPPLIEPDVRISRIRLSDQESCVRARPVAGPQRQSDQSQGLVQIAVGESCVPRPDDLMLRPQPLAEPITDVPIHGTIGGADLAQLEVVGPTCQSQVQTHN